MDRESKNLQQFTKEDVYRLIDNPSEENALNKEAKQGVEKSRVYITYKLVW